MKSVFLALVPALLLALTPGVWAASSTDGQIAKAVVDYAINVQHRQLIPAIGRVAVAGGYAVAGWTSGANNGESLVRRVHGAWRVVAAGTMAFETRDLVRDGVPAATAKALIAKLAALERSQTEAG